MNITITGRKMNVSDALRAYVNEKIDNALRVVAIDPYSVEVVLYREKNPSNPCPACCEITLRMKKHIIRVEEHEEDIYAAIDIATVKVERQMRKFKTRVIDRKVRAAEGLGESMRQESQITNQSGELDFDKLMDDLTKDEEVVRVKEIEFPPLTEQEALVEIDLLGHDFFAYTDRDTNLVSVLYRRNGGGYGLLKQME